MTEKTMWRVPRLPKEEYTDASREVQAFWGEPGAWENGSATNIIQVMANNAPLGAAYNVWGIHFVTKISIPKRHYEMCILRVAWRTQSSYEWHNHVGYALNLGMTLEEIAATKDGWTSPVWQGEDKIVLKGVDELMDTSDLSDETWGELSAFYDRGQMMDYIFNIGHYVMTSWAINAMRMPLEDYADPIGWDLKTRSGKTPTATQKPGESEDWAENRGYDTSALEEGKR